MADKPQHKHLKPEPKGASPLGFLNEVPSLSTAEVIGLALSLVWVAACAMFFIVLGTGPSDSVFNPLRFVMVVVAIAMPVAMIWVAVAAMRSARIMRQESTRLKAAIDGMRTAYLQQQQGVSGNGVQVSKVEQKLEEIAKVSRRTETALATFVSIRPGMPSLTNPHPAPIAPALGADEPSNNPDDRPAWRLAPRPKT